MFPIILLLVLCTVESRVFCGETYDKHTADVFDQIHGVLCAKRYEKHIAGGKWHFSVQGCDYDDFDQIPGVTWHRRWAESIPLHSEFKVPVEHELDAVAALEGCGYTLGLPGPNETKCKASWLQNSA